MSFALRGRRSITVSSRARLAVLALLAATGTFTAATPAGAEAHAILQSTAPAAGSTLGSAPEGVALTFSETPDVRLTFIRVLDSGGTDHVAGDVEAVTEPPATVRVPLDDLPDGVYTVSWRTVSSVDGHTSAGSFAFGVGVAAPSGPSDEPVGGSSASGSLPAVVARWVLYLGLTALIGAAFVALAVARREAPDLLTLAAAGWLLTAGGTLATIAVQWAETGAPIETLPSTSVGAAALARVLALLLVGAGLAALAVVPGMRGRSGWLAVGLAAVLAVVVDVGTGHAAAGTGWLSQVAIQSAHGVAAGVWVGGLAALLVLLRSIPTEDRLPIARRFSEWAGWALAIVALSGVIRAWGEIGTVDALFNTDFGRVVVAKSGLLLALAGLGAFNRFVNLRNAGRLAAGLRRIGGAEITLAVVVLGLSGLLVNLTPPASAGGPAPPAAPAIVATGSDFGTSVRARLVATPGPAGVNEFDVALVDFDTGEPVEASGVELQFELASQPGIEASTLDLERVDAGRFRATGANLGVDGIYRVVATVALAGGAVEIPLIVTTTLPPQPVETLVTPGLPTIYTVGFDAGGWAQVYLDPGAPGPNELHVTFFDPSGAAMAVESAAIAAVPSAGPAELPSVRRLDVGHFVASIEVAPGALAVDVIGSHGNTGQLHVHVTIEVQP